MDLPVFRTGRRSIGSAARPKEVETGWKNGKTCTFLFHQIIAFQRCCCIAPSERRKMLLPRFRCQRIKCINFPPWKTNITRHDRRDPKDVHVCDLQRVQMNFLLPCHGGKIDHQHITHSLGIIGVSGPPEFRECRKSENILKKTDKSRPRR